MEHLLEVKNLTVLHRKETAVIHAVDNLSFHVDEGEILGIAGVSGCGKTTLALAIPKLLSPKAEITQGRIVYQGRDVIPLSEEDMCRLRGDDIAMIFQETKQALNPLVKVGRQIMETLELRASNNSKLDRIAKRQHKKLALEMLSHLGFENAEQIFNAYPHELSGGMSQRVMIAIACIVLDSAPRLLIADEPSSSLDEESQRHILSFLLEMNRNYKTTIIIISHDLGIIRQFCTRHFVMQSGKIIEDSAFTSLSFPRRKDKNQSARSVPQDESTRESILSVRNISNVYVSRTLGLIGKKESKAVLHDVNLEIKRGKILGLIGSSGCGKTTLANCILGLISYDGEILIDGETQRANPHLVQMVFQEPGSSLNPAKKIGWLMEEPLLLHKQADSYNNAVMRIQKVDDMLRKVGLDPSYKTRQVHELSGGQKQRVCIARALLLEPRLLIADEAISSLDISSGVQILDLLNNLRDSFGLAILFISHNKDAVEYLCDRTLSMKDGRVFS
jgi:ABC-type glutathione transport system ATPase component